MDNNLFQLVRQTTRSINILDLVIVTDIDTSIHPTIVPKLIANDHEYLHISLAYGNLFLRKIRIVRKRLFISMTS